MSPMKNRFVPESSFVAGVLICLIVVAVKHYYGKAKANDHLMHDFKANQIISTLTENYVDQLGKGEKTQPMPVNPTVSSNLNLINLKPTDPKLMIGKVKAEEAAATRLLEMADRKEQPAKPTVAPQTNPANALGFPASVTFFDALTNDSPTASIVTQDVSVAKNWLFRNLGNSLEWFDRQMLQIELIDQVFEVLDGAKTDSTNLRLCFGSGIVGEDAAILVLRNNDNFLFNVPKEDQQRYGCVDRSIAHSQKGRWIAPGERIAKIDNMTCKVQPIENGEARVELAADCCFEVTPRDASYDVLAEIWIDGRCVQNIARFELTPEYLKKDAKFRFSTDLQLSTDLDLNRPFLVFLSLVKGDEDVKRAAELSWTPELASKYSSMSDVIATCYHGSASNKLTLARRIAFKFDQSHDGSRN